MNYQKFLCVVEETMNQRLKGGINASIHTVVKNNGKIKKGIMVDNPAVNISPTIYLEEFYERFQKGESLENIIHDLLAFYEAVKYERSWDTSKVTSYEAVRDKIVFKIIHTEENRELLKEIPHINRMDLSVVFYVLLEMKKDGTATMLISNEHMKIWGIEEGMLFPLACQNAQRLLPARLYMMKDILEEILNPEFKEPQNVLDFPEMYSKGEEDGANIPDGMFVLTNSCRSLGAACLLYPDIMDMAGKLMGESFYILPSSIHELILVPQSKGLSKLEMEEMVKEVNETQVKEEEQLSGHVYFYDEVRKNVFIL